MKKEDVEAIKEYAKKEYERMKRKYPEYLVNGEILRTIIYYGAGYTNGELKVKDIIEIYETLR